jgi:hypothetical protein
MKVGAGYTALKRISNRENQTLALPGETCERVPDEAFSNGALVVGEDIAPKEPAQKRGGRAEKAEG